jgi:hypothetical protein
VLPADEPALRTRLLAEHAEIRRRAKALGELLAAHVRFEERELFPVLEARLSHDELIELGRRLDGDGP